MQPDAEMEKLRRAMKVLAVPWLMVGTIVLFFFLGRYLDFRFGTSPCLTIALVVVAIIAGGYQSYRIFMKVLKD